MREIKFKALTLEGKIITNIGCIEFFEDGSIIVNNEIPVEKLIQYTGLKDKNGKEIYEGDVVTFPLVNYDTGKETTMTWEIKWINDEALFGMKANSGDELLMDINLKHLKIIGNIYMNPELLTIAQT